MRVGMKDFSSFVEDRQDEYLAFGLERTESGTGSSDLGSKEHKQQLVNSLIGERTWGISK